jgi:hypothetical protein
MAKLSLQTLTARARLAPRGKPYATRLLPGVWLGYRAAQSGTGAWLVIASDGKGGQWQKRIAHADDKQAADGQAVLNYEQAALKARSLARGDANAAADRPATIREALTNYEADLAARGRNPYNARLVSSHLPLHLAEQPLSQITPSRCCAAGATACSKPGYCRRPLTGCSSRHGPLSRWRRRSTRASRRMRTHGAPDSPRSLAPLRRVMRC